ncbi:DUF2256 domain-containing protein [Phreatobacter sp.]|uniref:DUF2256 domain-containing protein n=1 Tax=Phreatobacter sp. TaxID=1966341 RepID=UPI003F71D532
MAKMVRKGDLPQKLCTTCGRPFAWRKKWARAWAEVRHCSERCRGDRAVAKNGEAGRRQPYRAS